MKVKANGTLHRCIVTSVIAALFTVVLLQVAEWPRQESPSPRQDIPDPTGFFTENVGQVENPDILFYLNSGTIQAGFGASVVFLKISNAPNPKSEPIAPKSADIMSRHVLLRISFEGANKVVPEPRGELRHVSNFLLGSNPSKWRTSVMNYKEITYTDLYPGIDLVYHIGDRNALKYDFIIHPGADPDTIVITYEGAVGIVLGEDGDIVVHTAIGDLRDIAPRAYQGSRDVACTFTARGETGYGFDCAGWETGKSLVIDPLVYSTFLGGSGPDLATAVAIDAAGNAYVTGLVGSIDFPTTPGAFDTTIDFSFSSSSDVFVAKLTLAGGGASDLIYSTFLGGRETDVGYSISVDSDGNAYVSGDTCSTDFPVTPGAFDTSHSALGCDVFVTKLSTDGRGLVYSTFLGKPFGLSKVSMTVDASLDAYVVGTVGRFAEQGVPPEFPTTQGAFDTTSEGSADAFVAKLNAAGTALVYSTFLGGTGVDQAYSVAADSFGNAYVTGGSDSSDFPTTSGVSQRAYGGNSDAFVAKLNAAGTALVYSTFLGGTMFETGTSIALDLDGNAYVTGSTQSPDFPVIPCSFDTTFNGPDDAFVAKLNAAGTALVYSTFLGGAAPDGGVGDGYRAAFAFPSIAVDSAGETHVAGTTLSADFPTIPGTMDTTYGGVGDVFVAKLNKAGGALIDSTFLGGDGYEQVGSIQLDSGAHAYIVGHAAWAGQAPSVAFPTTTGAFDTSFNQVSGNIPIDSFVSKLELLSADPNTAPEISAFTVTPSSGTEGETAYLLGGDACDRQGDPLTFSFDFESDGVFDMTGSSRSVSHVYPDDFEGFATLRVDDGRLSSTTLSQAISVANAAPVPRITGPVPGALFQVGTPITFSGAFTDLGTADTHTASWEFASSDTTVALAGAVAEAAGSGSVVNTHTFTAAGVYRVTLTVTDDDGGVGTATTVDGLTALVVVFDPTAGFVTGGGWINSPQGAYAADPGIAGKAVFGFVSKYQKGANTPTGETEFQFKLGNLNFHSSLYEWLVCSGARAQYKGSGTINGAGDFGFLLTAIDGQLTGGGGSDKFRIKIWDQATSQVVYDNQMGADDFADPSTIPAGGSIVIHKS